MLPVGATPITITTGPSVPDGGATPTPVGPGGTPASGTVPTTTTIDLAAAAARAAKFVNVKLRIMAPKATEDTTYGPYTLNFSPVKVNGSNEVTDNKDTTSNSIPKDAPAGPVELYATFENVAPGLFKVCLQGYPSLCAGTEKEAGIASEITITVPESIAKTIATNAANSGKSCAIDGIGWIVCPVVNFLAKIADSAFYALSNNFLSTNIKMFDTSGPAYKAWVVMRNIANVAFVIFFLIIIFSQLTGAGIDNYGIKKLLPKIIIAAILVNISYFLCQIAVDLSNILGYSIKDLFTGLVPITTGTSASGWSTGAGFAGLAGGILGFGGAALVLYAALSTLIPVILAAVVALIMILFILIARQAIIILLIIISPLAFVAYLLPNTEKWFKKWQETLTSMLMLFPIVALIFGVSVLASNILSSTFGGVVAGDTHNWFGQIAAAAVLILPLFVVPSLLKKALDGVGSIGGKINEWGAKRGTALGARYTNSDFNKYNQGQKAKRAVQDRAGAYEGKNPFRKLRSGTNKLINRGWFIGSIDPTTGQRRDPNTGNMGWGHEKTDAYAKALRAKEAAKRQEAYWAAMTIGGGTGPGPTPGPTPGPHTPPPTPGPTPGPYTPPPTHPPTTDRP